MSKEKKIKCYKCGIYFKDRKDPDDFGIYKELCFNCRFIWKTFATLLESFPPKLNRKIKLNLDDIKIIRNKK